MKTCVYIAQSLDGFIAGPNGELDWLEAIDNPTQSDFGFAEFMAGIDALVMGRKTFEKVLSFGHWPYDKPVFVVSNSLSAVAPELAEKVFVLNGTPRQICTQLAEQGYQNLYIDGGKLIQSFLAEDLINELTVTTVPVLLGEGIPLFGGLAERVPLRLLHSEVLLNQLVKTRYVVVK